MGNSASYQHSNATPYKQTHLEYLLRILMPIWKSKRLESYQYLHDKVKPILHIDLNAGPGFAPTGEPGSPVIFTRVADAFPGLPIDAYFYEHEAEPFRQLTQIMGAKPCDGHYLAQSGNKQFHLYNTDNAGVSSLFARNSVDHHRMGLVYADPSNADMIEVVDRIRRVACRTTKVDLLINYAASSWKRQVDFPHYRTVVELFNTIPRQNILIREPFGQFQWTMFLFTNWYKFPADENRLWYHIKSPKGHDAYNRVAYTKNQRDNLPPNQPPLFGDLA